MLHRLSGLSTYGLNGRDREMSTPPTLRRGTARFTFTLPRFCILILMSIGFVLQSELFSRAQSVSILSKLVKASWFPGLIWLISRPDLVVFQACFGTTRWSFKSTRPAMFHLAYSQRHFITFSKVQSSKPDSCGTNQYHAKLILWPLIYRYSISHVLFSHFCVFYNSAATTV